MPTETKRSNIQQAKGAKDFAEKDAVLRNEGYFYCLPKSRNKCKAVKDEWRELMSQTCGTTNKSGAKTFLSPQVFFGGGTAVACNKCGTKGLGWVSWGPYNSLPNVVALLTSTLPYTAAGHKFNTDLLAGLGPQAMYRYTQYVGGNLTTKEVPFEDAGVLLKGWLTDLRRELQQQQPDGSGSTISTNGFSVSSPEDTPIAKDLKERIAELEEKYKDWFRQNEEIKDFCNRNNLQLYAINIAVDQTMFGISFPEIGLQKDYIVEGADGKHRKAKNKEWRPKAVQIKVRPCHTCRLEQMDEQNRINYVYISNQWWNSAHQQVKDMKTEDFNVSAIAALDPYRPYNSLEESIRKVRNGDYKKKDFTRFIFPTYYYTAGRPYYPVPAWYSIFGGDIYEYSSTIISDRLTRKKNENIIGRVIYVHHDYLESLYTQQTGKKKKTKEQLRDAIYTEINEWLSDRRNNGSSLLAFTFVGRDGKEHDSWRIVEIESSSAKGNAEANQKELQEVSSIIFFAMGLDSRLIGNTPGDATSTGGTDLRERYLLKQIQMSPTQQLILKPLDLIAQHNEWKDCVWRIKREVLTTLDNSKTGVTSAETK